MLTRGYNTSQPRNIQHKREAIKLSNIIPFSTDSTLISKREQPTVTDPLADPAVRLMLQSYFCFDNRFARNPYVDQTQIELSRFPAAYLYNFSHQQTRDNLNYARTGTAVLMEVASLQTVIVAQVITSSWVWGTKLSNEKLVQLLLGTQANGEDGETPDYFKRKYGAMTLEDHVELLVKYGLVKRQARGRPGKQKATSAALGFSNNAWTPETPDQPQFVFPDLLVPTRLAIYRFLELLGWFVAEAGDIRAQHGAVLQRLEDGYD